MNRPKLPPFGTRFWADDLLQLGSYSFILLIESGVYSGLSPRHREGNWKDRSPAAWAAAGGDSPIT